MLTQLFERTREKETEKLSDDVERRAIFIAGVLAGTLSDDEAIAGCEEFGICEGDAAKMDTQLTNRKGAAGRLEASIKAEQPLKELEAQIAAMEAEFEAAEAAHEEKMFPLYNKRRGMKETVAQRSWAEAELEATCTAPGLLEERHKLSREGRQNEIDDSANNSEIDLVSRQLHDNRMKLEADSGHFDVRFLQAAVNRLEENLAGLRAKSQRFKEKAESLNTRSRELREAMLRVESI